MELCEFGIYAKDIELSAVPQSWTTKYLNNEPTWIVTGLESVEYTSKIK